MTRVFHLVKGLGRGGAETLLTQSLKFSRRERFIFAYGYFLPWKNALVEDLTCQGAEVVCFECRTRPGILASAFRVARALRAWRADILHCHLPLAGVVGRSAALLAGIPVVYTEHNTFERYHPLTRRLNVLSWRWQEVVIAVSRGVADSVRRHVGESVPVRVVRNGIDAGVFNDRLFHSIQIRESLGLRGDAPVVGTVAIFRTQKALDQWLIAAQSIRRQLPAVQFLLVGDGPLRGELERITHDLGLQDAVTFAGLREDVRPFISAMDVYLMSSRFEGLPLALLEAMAMRRPVVATAVGGVPELVVPARTGLLFPPDQPEALSRAVVSLLADQDLRDRLGEEARTNVIEHFSMERMTEQIQGVYEEVSHRSFARRPVGRKRGARKTSVVS